MMTLVYAGPLATYYVDTILMFYDQDTIEIAADAMK
jgi:hypothetical protein